MPDKELTKKQMLTDDVDGYIPEVESNESSQDSQNTLLQRPKIDDSKALPQAGPAIAKAYEQGTQNPAIEPSGPAAEVVGKAKKLPKIDDSKARQQAVSAMAKALGESTKANQDTNATVESPYNSIAKQLGQAITDAEEAKRIAKQQDTEAQRRSAAFQMFAGLSDGLAAIGNLIGVAKGGSNINMGTGASSPFAEKAEQARLQRKADIDTIDRRLEQYRNQLLQARLGQAGAEATAAENDANRAFKKSEREATQKWTSGENDKKALVDVTIAQGKIDAQNAIEQYKQEQANWRAKYAADHKGTSSTASGANAPAPIFLNGEDGSSWTRYDLTKAELEAIDRVFDSAVNQDLLLENNPDSALALAWETYTTERKRPSMMRSKEAINDARNTVIQYSPTLRKMITNGRTGTKLNSSQNAGNADMDEFSANRVE